MSSTSVVESHQGDDFHDTAVRAFLVALEVAPLEKSLPLALVRRIQNS
ncbi:hypothetical protein ACPOL_5369 [Acidisarcina polymorpha]|uniref:Uncharacterized protein n=1 Tax=Acidisarcina polymorpha TaxID=2211140 RepID=A0A2Z5G741_9BACT|nr:hypothetical protein ACPOL_5369 [Acidisarcina polymorpha]